LRNLNKYYYILLAMWTSLAAEAQVYDSAAVADEEETVAIPDVKEDYIHAFRRSNDVRIFYGGEGASLAYGSKNKDSNELNSAVYNNANDLLGFGVSYKIIDGDVAFSLPTTRLMEDDRENLSQFRLSIGYTSRLYSVRGFLVDYHGMVAEDVAREFKSEADVRLFRMGAQFTYFFNGAKYSFRAANFQSEVQRKTAGSFLVRLEPAYRKIETASRFVPPLRDVPAVYGEQTGLHVVNAYGLIAMPGYGVNVVGGPKRKYFFSPYVFAGPGFAINTYDGDFGTTTSLNWEWAATAVISTGYNGDRFYATLRGSGDLYYIPLEPSYFTSLYLKVGITVGYRFRPLEKTIPSSLF